MTGTDCPMLWPTLGRATCLSSGNSTKTHVAMRKGNTRHTKIKMTTHDRTVSGAASAARPISPEERRRHSRRVCSVLSEVFVMNGNARRFIGSGVVLDISESGLALAMDHSPLTESSLFIRNAYFDVQAQIRNRTTKDGSTRLGVEFTSAVNWHAEPNMLPSDQPPSSRAGSSQPLSAPSSTRKTRYDSYAVYRKFLNVLSEARCKLPDSVRTIHPRDEGTAKGQELR
jgi:PilZ domain